MMPLSILYAFLINLGIMKLSWYQNCEQVHQKLPLAQLFILISVTWLC